MDSGDLIVRVEPPGAKFHLILDSFRAYHPRGPNLWQISQLTDERLAKYDVIRTSAGPITCKRGSLESYSGLVRRDAEEFQPPYPCGLIVEDAPVKWGVLFDSHQLKQADEIRRRAAAAIKAYRQSPAR
jgi:hypothetical protein